MRRVRTLVGSCVAAAVLLASESMALGDEAPPPTTIEVFVAAPAPAMGRIESAVAERERKIRWIPVAHIDEADVLARPHREPIEASAWVDAARPDRIRVYFANGTADRFLVREVLLTAGFDEAALETLAQVIESSISALVAGPRVGLSREEMRARLGSRPPSRWRASYGACYVVEGFSTTSVVAHGPGLGASVDRNARPVSIGAWLSAQILFPQSIENNLAGVRLDTAALRGGMEVARAIGERVELAGRVGLGGDLVHVAPRLGSAGAAVALSESRWTWGWAAQVALGATVHLGGPVAWTGAVFTDFDLALRHYDVRVAGDARRVFTPWLVHPGLMAGFSWP